MYIVPVYISKHSYFNISDIKLDLDSVKRIDIYHDDLDGVGITVYYKDGTEESFGNDYYDSLQDTIYSEDSYGLSHDLRVLMNPNSSYKDFTFIDFWDWEEFYNPTKISEDLDYLNYYYPIKKKRRNREKDSHKYKAKHKRYQDKNLNLYNDADYLEAYFERHPLPDTSVKSSKDMGPWKDVPSDLIPKYEYPEELCKPVTPSYKEGSYFPRGTGKTTPAPLEVFFYRAPQIQLSDLACLNLFWVNSGDTRYHRPRSNDIFYRRHKRKNK